MNVVLVIGHLKFSINRPPREHNPPHVHVKGGGAEIRINLRTLEIMDAETGFSKSTVRMILEYVEQNREILMEKWSEYHEQKD